VILEKTFSFSLRIVELCNILEENRKYAIANRPRGWTAGEAQRAHRAANAKHVAAIKAQKRA